MEEITPQMEAARLCGKRLEIRWHRAGLRYRITARANRWCENRRPFEDKYEELGQKLEVTNEQLEKFSGKTFNVERAEAKLYVCLDGVHKGRVDLLFKVRRVPCGIARILVEDLLERLTSVPTPRSTIEIQGMEVSGLFQFDGRREGVQVTWLKNERVLAEFKKKLRQESKKS